MKKLVDMGPGLLVMRLQAVLVRVPLGQLVERLGWPLACQDLTMITVRLNLVSLVENGKGLERLSLLLHLVQEGMRTTFQDHPVHLDGRVPQVPLVQRVREVCLEEEAKSK